MLIGSLSIGDLTFVGSQANERIAAMEKSLEQLRKEAEKAPLLLVEMHFYQPAFQMWKCQSAVAGQRIPEFHSQSKTIDFAGRA